mmetsp:Transcript_149954/g.481876  ORF Transcript_149954/g.481876 Transcript_149954/m.481876 type:complete len:262 (+) Transcript_149954:134-919(+)
MDLVTEVHKFDGQTHSARCRICKASIPLHQIWTTSNLSQPCNLVEHLPSLLVVSSNFKRLDGNSFAGRFVPAHLHDAPGAGAQEGVIRQLDVLGREAVHDAIDLDAFLGRDTEARGLVQYRPEDILRPHSGVQRTRLQGVEGQRPNAQGRVPHTAASDRRGGLGARRQREGARRQTRAAEGARRGGRRAAGAAGHGARRHSGEAVRGGGGRCGQHRIRNNRSVQRRCPRCHSVCSRREELPEAVAQLGALGEVGTASPFAE